MDCREASLWVTRSQGDIMSLRSHSSVATNPMCRHQCSVATNALFCRHQSSIATNAPLPPMLCRHQSSVATNPKWHHHVSTEAFTFGNLPGQMLLDNSGSCDSGAQLPVQHLSFQEGQIHRMHSDYRDADVHDDGDWSMVEWDGQWPDGKLLDLWSDVTFYLGKAH